MASFSTNVFHSFFLVCLYFVLCDGKLNVITITAGGVPFAGGAPSIISAVTIAPAYAVALDDMSKLYPTLFANYSLNAINIDQKENPCTPEGDWMVIQKFVKLYGLERAIQSNGPTVILNSICARTFPIIGDFAREDNVLTISCGPSESAGSQARFPTTMTTFPGSPLDYGMALVALLDSFAWKTIAVIWDLSSAVTNAGRVEGLMRGLLPVLQQRSADIDLMLIKMDSTKENKPYARALWMAGNHSRIILCGALHQPLRELLAVAFELGLTSGEYVFLYVYILQIPTEHPAEWKEGDELDLKVREAFKRILVIRSTPMDWNSLNTTAERIVRRGNEMFDTAYDAEYKLQYKLDSLITPNPVPQPMSSVFDKWNEFAIGCYESVELLSQVLNNSHSRGNAIDPSNFLGHLKGKTYPLTFRNITFDSHGARPSTIVLQIFDDFQGRFKGISSFEMSIKSWSTNLSSGQIWKIGEVPPDQPPCGIWGERCQSVSFGLNSLAIVMPIVSLGGIAVIIALSAFIWYQRQYLPKSQAWWCIELDPLIP